MTKVIVIGGGASGLAAAICAARKGHNVTILERNDSLAKKILITGNGKCNYWNEDQSLEHYHSTSEDLLLDILNLQNQNKVLEFFDSLGVIPKIKNGYYYPYSNQAVSIKAILINEILSLNVKVKTNTFVDSIKKVNEEFIINTEDGQYRCESVILATGSKAMPKTGSDGFGYNIAKSFGHTIIPVLPSLTQVYGAGNYYKVWNGIRVDAKLSLYEDNNLLAQETGELHLTDYGLSGICVFNLSGRIAKGLNKQSNEVISINFVSDLNILDCSSFINWIDERNNKLDGRKIDQLFDGFINYKLVYLFLELAHIDSNLYWNDLTLEKKIEFAKLFLEHKVNIIKTSDFDKTQVCSGGISLQEVDLHRMESKKVKGLYFTGEILDVDGDCGGYNLGFAWISGIVAGNSVGEKND